MNVSLMNFLETVIGIPPSVFEGEMDLLKAETLRVMLKLFVQVASVDPLLLYGNRDTGIIDSSILNRCLNFYMRLANADY